MAWRTVCPVGLGHCSESCKGKKVSTIEKKNQYSYSPLYSNIFQVFLTYKNSLKCLWKVCIMERLCMNFNFFTKIYLSFFENLFCLSESIKDVKDRETEKKIFPLMVHSLNGTIFRAGPS